MCYTEVIIDCGNGDVEDIYRKIENISGVRGIRRDKKNKVEGEKIGSSMKKITVEIDREDAEMTIERIRSMEDEGVIDPGETILDGLVINRESRKAIVSVGFD